MAAINRIRVGLSVRLPVNEVANFMLKASVFEKWLGAGTNLQPTSSQAMLVFPSHHGNVPNSVDIKAFNWPAADPVATQNQYYLELGYGSTSQIKFRVVPTYVPAGNPECAKILIIFHGIENLDIRGLVQHWQ